MVVFEVLGGVVVLVLAAITTYMAFVGGLGVLGVLRYVRCGRCGHLTLEQRAQQQLCARCHHEVLFHPLHAMHGSFILHWHEHHVVRS
jgi:DNA-directed RNA polymerase subunit RPC12/RpoP